MTKEPIMKVIASATLVSLLALPLHAQPVAAVPPASPASQPTTAPSGTVEGWRIVRVTGDTPELTVDADSLDRQICELAATLAMKDLGLPLAPGQYSSGYVAFNSGRAFTGSSKATGWVEFHLHCCIPYPHPGARPAVREFMNDLCDAIPKLVQDQYQNKIKPVIAWIIPKQEEVRQLRAAAQGLEVALKKRTGWLDVSGNRIQAEAAKLDDQQQALDLDLVAKEARRQALQENIGKLSQKTSEQLKTDPIAQELAKIVAIREERLADTQKLRESNSASPADVKEATLALAEARVRLAERQRDMTLAAGGDTLADWNRQLLALSVDTQELKARHDYIGKRLEELKATAQLCEQLAAAQQKVTDADNELKQVVTGWFGPAATAEQVAANAPAPVVKDEGEEKPYRTVDGNSEPHSNLLPAMR